MFLFESDVSTGSRLPDNGYIIHSEAPCYAVLPGVLKRLPRNPGLSYQAESQEHNIVAVVSLSWCLADTSLSSSFQYIQVISYI